MNELMKLDPSFQVKKGRRKSTSNFKKNCGDYPQPSDLDTNGIDLPLHTNFSHILRNNQ